MTLLTEIADALGSNHGAIERDFGCYVVGDLVPPAPKTILLLESPHVYEAPAGHPLAGLSGKAVTRALKQNRLIRPMLERIERVSQGSSGDEAIGCILQRCPGTLRLGLMNASRLPLQINVYADPDPQEPDKWYRWQQLHSEFLCLILQTVKNLPELLSEEAENHAFRVCRILLNDLKSRLDGLLEDTLVVPCGEVARAFVDVVTNSEEYQGTAQICDQEVPHPSYSHWTNKQVVTSLVNMIHERSLPHA